MRIEVKPMSNEELLRQLLDAIPSYIFLMDSDCAVQDYNTAAGVFLGQGPHQILRRRGGEVFHCIHSTDVAEGCGRGEFCRNCLIRGAVGEAFAGRRCVRRHAKMELASKAGVKELNVLITASPFLYQGYRWVALILEDLDAIGRRESRMPHGGN
jgi:PAS domain-containing protein